MKDQEIIQLALENLENQAGIKGNWDYTGMPIRDAHLTLTVDGDDLHFNVEAIKNVRPHHLTRLQNIENTEHDYMLVANKLTPQIKEQLRVKNIAYLEANGNLFVKQHGKHIWIETNNKIQIETDKGNRAFGKTGLKVIFLLLQNPALVNAPYRDLAAMAGVALGNIVYVMNGLKEYGFIIRKNDKELLLTNRKELLEKWLTGYEDKLKPSLLVGKFRMLDEYQFTHWRNMPLPDDERTVWGGEPAGDLYTNYLRPGQLTLYTTAPRKELMQHFKMTPDSKDGNVLVYKKFWNNPVPHGPFATPALLTYADLILMDEKRCRETAQMIFNEHIQPNL